MELEIITIYCVCEDLLRAIDHSDDSQSQMSTAQIITTALVASF